MKKIFFVLVALVAFSTVQAQEHVEFKWHRFYGVAGYDFSMNLNKTDWNDAVRLHGFYVSGGWQIRRGSGIGLGVEYMLDPTGAFTQLPVYIELRSHYLRNRVTPYTNLSLGYTIPLKTSSGGSEAIQIAKGGPMWNLAVGARYAFTPKFAMSAFVGYQGLYLTQVDRKVEGKLANSRPLLLHNLKMGIGFNF